MILSKGVKKCLIYRHVVKINYQNTVTTKGPVREGNIMVDVDLALTTHETGTRITPYNVPRRVAIYFFLFGAVPELEVLYFKIAGSNTGESIFIYREDVKNGVYQIETDDGVDGDHIVEQPNYKAQRDEWLKKYDVLVRKARHIVKTTRYGGSMSVKKLLRKSKQFWETLTPEQQSGKTPVDISQDEAIPAASVVPAVPISAVTVKPDEVLPAITISKEAEYPALPAPKSPAVQTATLTSYQTESGAMPKASYQPKQAIHQHNKGQMSASSSAYRPGHKPNSK